MILSRQIEAGQVGRPLEHGDGERIMAALPCGPFAPAEYSFANLWLFRDVHLYRLVEGAFAHVRGVTYDGAVHALPLTALSREGADALFATGVQCLYPYGPEGPALAARLGLEVAYEDADADYWYRGSDMAVLAGAKHRRAQARDFNAQAEPSFVPWSDARVDDANAILEGWAEDVARGADQTDMLPCREAILRAEQLGLQGGVVYAREQPVAFLLASVRGDTRIVHFAKGRRAHSSAYPWMFATFAARSGAAWLNFEQDLGISGLAQSKRAYAPLRIQRKFRLRKSLLV